MDSNKDESEADASVAEQTAQAKSHAQNMRGLWANRIFEASRNTGYNFFDHGYKTARSIEASSLGSMGSQQLGATAIQPALLIKDAKDSHTASEHPHLHPAPAPPVSARKHAGNRLSCAALEESQHDLLATSSSSSPPGWFPSIEPGLFSEPTPFYERSVSPVTGFSVLPPPPPPSPSPPQSVPEAIAIEPVLNSTPVIPIPEEIQELAKYIGSLKQVHGMPTRLALKTDPKLKGEFVPKTGLMRSEEKGSKLRSWYGDERLFDLKMWNYLVEKQ